MLKEWAKAVLKLPNLLFLVIDTTGVNRDSDIIRATVVDPDGKVLFDKIIRPVRQPGVSNFDYTSISRTAVLHAAPFAEVWPELMAMLVGKYVLSYGRDFIIERLMDNARAYNVPTFYPVGDCLHYAAAQYFGFRSMKLTDACRRIGYPLPEHPLAVERAQAQIALLQAMSEGRTSPPVRFDEEVDEDEEDEDLEDHPF